VRLLTPLWTYIDALVHPTAQQDVLMAVQHRAFIAPRLLGSLAALASFPVYIAVRGVPSVLEISIFSWLAAPILIVCYLSRTGRYQSAHVLSAVSLTGLATLAAMWTGGVTSFATIWLVVVPLEAALSASRRVIVLAVALAMGATSLLLALGAAGLLPHTATSPDQQAALASLGTMCATLYATGLALGVELLVRTGHSLLRAEEDRYDLLAYSMSDVIVRHDRDGSVLSVSPGIEALGVTPNELADNGLFDRVHVSDRPAYLTALADVLGRNEDRTLELRIRRANGQFVWVEMRCRAINPGAERSEVVSILRDINDRKLQERAIEIARAESERADAAKNRFVATMSHELRTPLNAIIGFSDMLTNESLELDAERKLEYAKLIKESGQHLLSVVNGILDVSKMETGNFQITPEPFAPAPAIENCADLLAVKAQEAGVNLTTRIAPDLPEVAADRRAFTQILINLLSNAIKFTPRGGRVIVSASCDGPNLALVIQDTGVGISESDLPRLGEAFFQGRALYDGRRDGSGLGLSIVKGLIRLHGGEFDIKSRLGEGTRVTVRLPFETANEPIKLETERNRSRNASADNRVKKSA
jgi:two-component system, cell cycle sensor histidine kinase DivJ